MLLAVTALHTQPAEGTTFHEHAELSNVLPHVNDNTNACHIAETHAVKAA